MYIQSARTAKALVWASVVLVICSCREADSLLDPGTPAGKPDATAAFECVARIRAAVVACTVPQTKPNLPRGASGDLILGGQHVYVRLISSNISVDTDTRVFAFDTRLENLIRQPLNTVDGSAAAAGIDIFFQSEPVGYPLGEVTVKNPDGHGTYTMAGQPYFRYDASLLNASGMLAQFDTSAAKRWELQFESSVDSFAFRVLVSAPVQHPTGWVKIDAPSSVVPVGATLALTDSVFSAVGEHQTAETVVWTSADETIATVDASRIVTGVAPGSITITATSSSGKVGQFSLTVSHPVDAGDLEYDALGNVARLVTAPGLLQGQIGAHVLAATTPTDAGGTLATAGDGSFTYISAPGFAGGRDSAQFVVTNGVFTDTAWVKFDVTPAHVWYVQNDFSGASTGTSLHPFQKLADAVAAAPAGDTILVYTGDGTTANYGAITLKAGHVLLGQGISADLTSVLDATPVTWFDAGGAAPMLGGTITLATDNTIAGVFIETDGSAAIFGNSFGNLAVRESAARTSGAPVLNLTTGTGDVQLDSVFSTSSTGRGMLLRDLGGSVVIGNGLISNADAAGVEITAGTATISLGVDIVSGANGRPVRIQELQGGTITFSGSLEARGNGLHITDNSAGSVAFTGPAKVLNTGANRAINTGNNGSLQVSFMNGGLQVTTTTADGINVNRTGLTIQGSDNTITTESGSALWLSNLQLAGPVQFRSVNVNAHAGCDCGAIVLDRVEGDASTAIEVSGTGAAASGGVIQAFNGSAVSLTSTTAPLHLKHMTLRSDTSGTAVRAIAFALLDLDGSTIDATNGAQALYLAGGSVAGNLAALNAQPSPDAALMLAEVDGSLGISSGSISGASLMGLLYIWKGGVDLAVDASMTYTGPSYLLYVDGDHTGTLDFGGTLANQVGDGIYFGTANGRYNFTGSLALNGTGGIRVDGATGAFHFNATTQTTPHANRAMNITGGSPNITYDGTIASTDSAHALVVQSTSNAQITFTSTIASTGRGVLIADNNGGTVEFQDKVTIAPSTPQSGVRLNNNPGTTMRFGAVDITTTDSVGFYATGAGVLELAAAGSKISTTRAPAVQLEDITLAAAGVSFRRIDANGGKYGIYVRNATGGPLTVSGSSGASGSAGRIVHADTAIVLDNTTANLAYMRVDSSRTQSVYLRRSNLTASRMLVYDNLGNSLNPALSLLEPGAVVLQADTVIGANGHLVDISAAAGSRSVSISDSEFSNTASFTGGSGVNALISGSADLDLNIENSSFRNHRAPHIALEYMHASKGQISLHGNTIVGKAVGDSTGISARLISSDTVGIVVTGNTISGTSSHAIQIRSMGSELIAAKVDLLDNVIGNANPGSCSLNGYGILLINGSFAAARSTIRTNTISNCAVTAIGMGFNDVGLVAVVQGNTIVHNGSGPAFNATSYNVDGIPQQHCLDLGGDGANANSFSGIANPMILLERFDPSFMHKFYLAGITAGDEAGIAAEVQARNGGASTTVNAGSAVFGFTPLPDCPF